MSRQYVLLFVTIFLISLSAHCQEKAVLKVNSGHPLTISSLSFSPDETKLASASWDKSIKIWDVATGREIVTLTGHLDNVKKVDFTNDGSRLVSSSWDRTVKIWDTRTWELLNTIKVPKLDENYDNDYDNSNNDFSIYSDRFIALYIGSKIYVYDVENGKLVKKLSFFEKNKMYDLVVNTNGIAFASAGYPNANDEWFHAYNLLVNLNTGKVIRELPSNSETATFSADGNLVTTHDYKELLIQETVSGSVIKKTDRKNLFTDRLQFLPDGKQIAGGSNDSISILDITTGKTEFFIVPTNVQYNPDILEFSSFAFTYSKSGKFAALAIGNPSILTLRDGKTLEELKTFGGNTYQSYHVCFTKDNRHFYSIGDDGYIKKWNLETMKMESLNGKFANSDIVFSNQTDYALLTNEKDQFQIIQFEEDKIMSGASCNNATVSDDGKMIVYTDRKEAKVYIIDPTTWKITKTFNEAHSDIGNVTIAISPNKKYVASSNSSSGPLFLWNLQSNVKERTLLARRSVEFLKFIDDNTLMVGQETAEGYFGSKITMLSVPDFSEISSVEVGAQFDFSVHCFTADGNFGYFGSDYTGYDDKDYPIYKVNLKKGTIDSKLLGHHGEVNSLSLSEDENFLISGSGYNKNGVENQLKIWDTKKMNLIKTIDTFVESVESVDISSDNKFIIGSSYDKSIRLFHLDGTEIVTIVPVKNSLEFIAMTPDGNYTSSKGAHSIVHYTKGKNVYAFDQFDLQYNRPDILLSRIGLASPELIKAYKGAYLKRLKKMKIDESAFEKERSFNIPIVMLPLLKERYFSMKERTFNFDVEAIDPLFNFSSLNIRVNGVPIYGVNGIDLRKNMSKGHSTAISLPLGSGSNVVEVTAMNEKGVESLAERFEVVCETVTQPNLYVVALGVSEFKESAYNLTYAAKDANDLADLYNANKGTYANVNVLKLTDKEAVIENLPLVKQFLQQTKPDDVVIAFVASHGLLDDSLNYYLALHDTNFENPSEHGLKYEELENLLDGIGARKKILFMDACHSGEVDKEETVVTASIATNEGQVKN